MITKISPDIQKAQALKETAVITFRRLQEGDQLKYPSNTLKDYYDILHALMDALLSLEGVKVKGEGAHKETIDQVASLYKLSDSVRMFLQEMREYRNRISYEGFHVKETYISANRERIIEIMHKLLALIEEELGKMERRV